MSEEVLLINTNTTRPLVSPIGLEYVGESLLAAGISVLEIGCKLKGAGDYVSPTPIFIHKYLINLCQGLEYVPQREEPRSQYPGS